MHSNPHLYTAYAEKILNGYGETVGVGIFKYTRSCQTFKGLYHRFPDGGGGVTSHDELIGIISHAEFFAVNILYTLEDNNGVYDNQNPDNPNKKHNLSRFPWFTAYVKTSAFVRDYRTPFYNTCYAIYLIDQALRYHPTKRPDDGGRLLTWLMSDKMRKQPYCRLAHKFWDWRMRKSGPKDCFSRYLLECPIFHELAPDRFTYA
jgi:hypothetical protein